MEGDWLNYKPGDDGDRKVLVASMQISGRDAEVIKRKDIPELLTPEVRQVIDNYWITRRYGLPYSDGWAEQSCVIIDILKALDNEDAIIQEYQRGQK